MENDQLKNIWLKASENNKNLDKEQLKMLLMEKNRKILRVYTVSGFISAIICVGVITWLILSFINHIIDPVFIIINSLIFVFTLTGLIIILIALKKINSTVSDKYNLGELLENKAKWMKIKFEITKYQWIYLIVYCVLFMLSISMWQHNQSIKDIFSKEEDLYGFAAGLIVAIPLMFYVSYKFNKFYLKKRMEYIKNLEELKN
jgi:hypothetical protein